MATISIIMGAYNISNRIEKVKKSVLSIRQQTFTDWEFIICDDGSEDNTYELLMDISKEDPRIKIIGYKTNCGLAHALNYCLKYSTGRYIARQDDDDTSAITRLEKEMFFLDHHNEFAFVGTMAKVVSNESVLGDYKVPENPMSKDFLWNSPFIHPTVMFRKEALTSVNGYRESRETRRCEDYDLFMRMYKDKLYGYNIQEPLYFYYVDIKAKSKHRPMKYRIDEFVVRYKRFSEIGLGMERYLYMIKPLVIGIIPNLFINLLNGRKYRG